MITPNNCTLTDISIASNAELIEAYSSSMFDFDDNQYDMIVEEMEARGILEI